MLSTTRTLFNAPIRRIAATASVSSRYNSTRFYTSTMHENDPEVLEREKQRNLQRTKEDKTSTPFDEYAPGWNETLASASEAAVKADKAPVPDPQTLQSKTVNFLKARRVETDGESSTTAYYSKDEVSGPLKDAEGKNGKEELVFKRGKVVELEEKVMTPSEEDVKADRGEI